MAEKTPNSAGKSDKINGPVPVAKVSSPFGVKLRRRAIPMVREIVVVASGKGGVGKSTVSTNLAAGLAKSGKKVGIVDADIYGPSIPMMMGVEGPMEASEAKGKLRPVEKWGVKIVSFGFLSDSMNPVIWRGPLVAKAFEQICYEVDWGELDFLIIDLPPGTGDIQMTMIERLPVSGALIVTTPQHVALLDAHKALTMFQRLEVPVIGVVENMAHYECAACGHKERIFGDEAKGFSDARGVEIIAEIPLRVSVRENCDQGTPAICCDSTEVGVAYEKVVNKVIEFSS